MFKIRNDSNKVILKNEANENIIPMYLNLTISLEPKEFANFETKVYLNLEDEDLAYIMPSDKNNDSLKIMANLINDGESEVILSLYNDSDESLTLSKNYNIANVVYGKVPFSSDIENESEDYAKYINGRVVFSNDKIIVKELEENAVKSVEINQEDNKNSISVILE